MKIGVITINDFDFHPNFRLREAALARGHELSLMNPYRTTCTLGFNGPGVKDWPGLEELDLVLSRQGALIGDYCLALVDQITSQGIPVVNSRESMRLTRNQFLTLQRLCAQKIPVPESYFITTEHGFMEAVNLLGGFPVVAKKANSWGGRGVALVENNPMAQVVVDAFLEERKGLLVQRFISPQGRDDLRVFILDQKVIGVMRLTPPPGDFRANFHVGGQAAGFDLPGHLKELALNASACMGLEICGVDIIVDQDNEPYVIEVNHSPGFRGLEQATGLDIAGMIIDYLGERGEGDRITL